jgi:ACS family hexuronate transporter-like MFS transporter
VAIVAALTMTVSYIDRATLSVLAPSVTKALDISETGYGWLTSAFSMAYLVSVPAAGVWIGRLGARRGLVASVLVWSIVAALHAVVPGFAILFVLRIALGVAEGPSFPGATQTVFRVLPERDRSRGFGAVFTGSSLGFMVAPPLAVALYELAGWRVAFLGTAAIGLLWIPLWVALTGRPDVRARLDVEALATPADHPPLRDLVRHPLMIRALIAIFAVAPVPGFVLSWGAKYLVRALDMPQGAVGRYLWLPPLCFDVGALLFGDLAARQRRAPGAPPRALCAVAALFASSLAVLPWAATPWRATACLGLCMAGAGAVYTLVTADLLARMPPPSVPFTSGVLAGAQSLAFIIAHPLIGGAVDARGGFGGAVVTLGAWVVPGSIVWWAWRPARSYPVPPPSGPQDTSNATPSPSRRAHTSPTMAPAPSAGDPE